MVGKREVKKPDHNLDDDIPYLRWGWDAADWGRREVGCDMQGMSQLG